MKQSWIYIILLIFLSACGNRHFHSTESKTGRKYKVLLIQSSDAGNILAINKRMIEQQFMKADIPVEVEYLYHLTQDLVPDSAIQSLKDRLKPYDESPPDLILTVNDDSFYNLMATNLPFTFKVPIVFTNVVLPSWKQIEKRENITGQIEVIDYRQAYELAQQLFGEIDEIQLIYGFQPTDRLLTIEAVRQFRQFPELSVLRSAFINGPEKASIDTVCPPEKLEHPLTVSFNLLTVWPFDQFMRYYDREKPVFPIRRVGIKPYGEVIYSSFFSYYYVPCINVTNAYFPTAESGVNGCIGGYMNTRENQAKVAVETSLRILKGEPVSHFPIDTAERIPIFDWNAMQHWKIPESKLPPGSRIVNKPFMLKYRNQLLAGGVLGGLVIAWLVSLLVIHSRKAKVAGSSAARKLKREQKRMQLTVNSIGEGILSFDRNGIITSINPAAQALLGAKDMHLIGKHIYSCLRLSPRNETKFYWLLDLSDEARESGAKQILPEGTLLYLRNNKTLQIVGVVRALFLNDEYIGTLLTFRDCTDKLRESRFLEFSMAAGDVYTWKMDEQDRSITFHESFFLKTEGQRRKARIPYSEFLAKVHPDDRKLCIRTVKSMRMDKQAGKQSIQLRFLLPGGYTWFEFRISSMPEIGLNNATRFSGICLSIQLQKETESSMIQILEEAEKSNQLKAEFLANMSHEIRTPLNVILGFSTIIEDVGPEERSEFLALINHNCDILLHTINDILDISRVQSGYPFQYKVCGLTTLFSEVWRDQQTLFDNQEVQLFLQLPDEDILIETDPYRLKQVLVQLIENASRFTPAGSVTIGFRSDEVSSVMLFVSDTGIGIRPEDRMIVFERFYKLDKFTAGGGLGLSICREIINRLGGTISIGDGLTGEGICVTIILPIHQPSL